MSIEICTSKNAVVIDNLNPGWLLAAVLFMGKVEKTLPSRTYPLHKDDTKEVSLQTFPDLDSKTEDTIGSVISRNYENSAVTKTIKIYSENHRYVHAPRIDGKYHIDALVQYNPPEHIK